MTNKETEIIVVQESVIASLVKDTVTYGMIMGLMYFNHRYLNGNAFIDVLFIFIILLSIVVNGSKQVRKFKSRQEAIDYLAPKGENSYDE